MPIRILNNTPNLEESIAIADNEKLGVYHDENFKEFERKKELEQMTEKNKEQEKAGKSCGMNNIITKPFVPEDFYRVISKYI